MVSIKLEGNAVLERGYVRGMCREEAYYIRLFLSAEEANNNLYAQKQLMFKVGISETQYQELEKKFQDSKSEEPILNVIGSLEVKLDSVCIN